ncbi:hypothetical protein MRX96_050760, partial [Rhipicephalus microplus]
GAPPPPYRPTNERAPAIFRARTSETPPGEQKRNHTSDRSHHCGHRSDFTRTLCKNELQFGAHRSSTKEDDRCLCVTRGTGWCTGCQRHQQPGCAHRTTTHLGAAAPGNECVCERAHLRAAMEGPAVGALRSARAPAPREASGCAREEERGNDISVTIDPRRGDTFPFFFCPRSTGRHQRNDAATGGRTRRPPPV